MSARANHRGFTLLEAIIAMAILALSLMAIFQISSQAVYAHVYAKKLTVATLLARSKMVDLEQELYEKGFNLDDDEQSGDFADDGWASYKWRAKIIAPKTNGLSPDQLIGAIFNLPTGGGEGEEGAGMGALAGLFGGGKPPPGAPATDPKAGMLGALGPAAGIAQQQFQTMIDTLQKSVREVHLTISWKEGKLTESIDLVTHVVSLGPGSDRNGGAAGAAGAPGAAGTGFVRADSGMPVPNAVPGADGSMRDPSDNTLVVPADQFGNIRPGPGAGILPRQFAPQGMGVPPGPGTPGRRPGFPQ
ncbi:MAG: gspI [Myxococcaceae bacterium]|nr:gspI [Myxococcaceae bacterium]